jgi:hypothetical protein
MQKKVRHTIVPGGFKKKQRTYVLNWSPPLSPSPNYGVTEDVLSSSSVISSLLSSESYSPDGDARPPVILEPSLRRLCVGDDGGLIGVSSCSSSLVVCCAHRKDICKNLQALPGAW